ncbi:MAG: rhomboid family intramembrane serine protease, partial [Limisphaerales bacterium]
MMDGNAAHGRRWRQRPGSLGIKSGLGLMGIRGWAAGGSRGPVSGSGGLTGGGKEHHMFCVEAEMANIPARSRRQAMDWSLVLLSQGIEHTIQRAEESSVWELVLTPEHRDEALSAIRLYQEENRHWPWRRELFQPGLLFDWASLAWVAMVCVFYWLSAAQPGFETLGQLDASAVSHGQWWRLFTAMWLHADLSHLASNAAFGFVLLGLAMGRYGTGAGLLAAYLAGALGNLLAWSLAPQPRYSLGASGMVMGCLGLLAIQSFSLWRRAPAARKYLLTGVLGGVMLFLLLGTAPGTDLLAHAGGFAGGLLLGAALTQIPRLPTRKGPNAVS